jgi:hypothetical protein
VLKNIHVDVAFERPDYAYELRGPALPFFHNVFPSSIVGIPDAEIENVTLENIIIRYPGRGNNGLAHLPITALDRVPENAADYPEFSMFGELPAWGFYVRHVKGLRMQNIRISIDQPDYRPAIVMDDVKDGVIRTLIVKGDTSPHQVVLYKNENVEIEKGIAVLKVP